MDEDMIQLNADNGIFSFLYIFNSIQYYGFQAGSIQGFPVRP
jgi:hypothetical protein